METRTEPRRPRTRQRAGRARVAARGEPESELVVRLGRRAAPRLVPFGESFLEERLPAGTRVIYPPPPLAPLPDPGAAIRQALLHPLESDPLFALLRPGMRVTVAFDDLSLPLPPMRRPDVRERVLGAVLQLLADYGVDDVHLVVATALHRRMTAGEIRRVVGERVFRAYYPERLTNHDAEDPRGMVTIGRTEAGEEVTINRRAAESDLLVYVNINLVPMDGGHKSVAVGLGSYASIRHHHNPATLRECRSYMDPTRSALHSSCERMGRVVEQAIEVFAVETTLDTQMYPESLACLASNEDRFTAAERWAVAGLRWTLERLPPWLRHEAFLRYRAPYGLTGVFAGRTAAVHARALERLYQQYSVPVRGQTDALIVGVPYICPYNVNSLMNPVLVQCTALGYLFNLYRGRPLVRPGGTLIVCHPLRPDFDPDHHPSYLPFYERCLAETTDSGELAAHYEESFARDPTFRHAYRHGHAYHGVHPFYMWYWGEPGRAHVGRVIAAGCEEPEVAVRLGWEAAPGLAEAIAMVRDRDGQGASFTYLHAPPLLIAEVS